MRRRSAGQLEMLLLAVLAGAPRHGYAVIEALRERSEGAFDLAEGTVYPALRRLEHAGLVRSRWSEVEGRRRRVYAVTGSGAEVLTERRTEWTALVRGVDAVLGWSS
jgi:PadR family transcriptional regulator PadR